MQVLNQDELLPADAKGSAALILLDGRADLEFDYAVPPDMEGKIAVGSRVQAPLRKDSVTGTVIAINPRTSEGPRLRDLIKAYDERPLITPRLMDLGRWISGYYMAGMESVMRSMLPEAVRTDLHQEKTKRFLRLLRRPEADEVLFAKLRKRSPRQADLINALAAEGVETLPASEWNPASIKKLAAEGWISIEQEAQERDPLVGDEFIATEPLPLNEAQQVALDAVLAAVESPLDHKPLLLHGVTGSGKTEVYLQAAQRVLDMGRSVLVLVPEISLAPQTVERFRSRFSAESRQVAVLHSHLSQGERFDEWHRIRRGEAKVVIGARSAVFAPLEDLGLIIVDEEHEGSYKQDSPPRYHARDVAVMRARMEGCAILLGSATPGLESWYNASRGKYALLSMTDRADGAELPLTRVIDMRLERRRTEKGTPAILSEQLRLAINRRLERKEQVILFLNRRGFAGSIQCHACGQAVKCKHCTVSMTLHKSLDRLVCHVCGFQRIPPRRCPECEDPGIALAGYGTERVEETLRRTFPQAGIARVDTDTMSAKHSLRDTLGAFKARKLDIIIGTQMIAKGLHFPGVTLVGVLNADLTLNLPDFRAGERTFSLLTQVAGRAGRGGLTGEVIVQTFSPHSPSVQYARHHDYLGFSEQELEIRRQCGYPPYGHAVLLTCRSEHEATASFTMTTLHKRLLESLPDGILMSDPNPSPLERSHNQFRFQVLLRARTTSAITTILPRAIARTGIPKTVLLTIDVDPVSLA